MSTKRHQARFIVGKDPNYKPSSGLQCVACNNHTEVVNSVYGRYVVNLLKSVVESKTLMGTQVVDCKSVIVYPQFKTGYACKQCFDTLYAEKYTDTEGNIKRGFECMNPPVERIKESYTQNGRERVHSVVNTRQVIETRDDNYASGKQEFKSYGMPIVRHGIEIGILKLKRPVDTPNEPIDPKAYRYFMKGH